MIGNAIFGVKQRRTGVSMFLDIRGFVTEVW